jgi:hypothetical protein
MIFYFLSKKFVFFSKKGVYWLYGGKKTRMADSIRHSGKALKRF